MNISPARIAAFDVLYRIETEKAFSSPLLSQYENDLSVKDRSLCHEIVLGCLRRQIYLDRIIDHFSAKPRLDAEIRVSLRIGIFQLLYLDKVPAYSAVNESVNLVQRAKKTSAKGLVNAVLRQLQRGRPEFSYADETERISVETSHPRWLIEKWTGEF
ncbi:MAG: transcription antitermination factor NusB, partial [Pyrinomonadaceae bacterium]